jgi:STE24 endopeptidase
MNEDKATRYHRLSRRAAVFSTLLAAAMLAGLLYSGGSIAVRDIAVIYGPSHMFVVALYVLFVSVLFDTVLFPLSMYRGFVLEHRYGLSTQTFSHWFKDHVKAGLISLLFAEAGAAVVFYTLRRWPDYWWVIAGAGYSLVTIVLVNLAPVLLLPLFFKFKPLGSEELRQRLTALASKAGTRIMGVYEWTLSDRTKKANAALTGLGNTRRILLSDTLLSDYSHEEIEVILAHELAHHVHRDIRTSVLFDIALTFAGFVAAHVALQWAVPRFGLYGPSDPAGIPVLLLSAGAIGLAAKPVLNAASRAHERRADAYALEMTRNPGAFVTAMKRLGQQNLAEDNPSRLVQVFFYTHPPIKQRLKAASEMNPVPGLGIRD